MLTWTNMAWPADPYRTGQILYAGPRSQLVAFTTGWLRGDDGARPACWAVAYLPLHRTCAVTVTGQTLVFGFRAARIQILNERPALAAMADADLMQARRHAAILAGHAPHDDLSGLQAAAVSELRGLAAAGNAWAGRSRPARGTATMIDTAVDLPGGPGLTGTCQQAEIALSTGARVSELADLGDGWPLAGGAVERALAIALACARHMGRYQWDGALDTGQILTAHAWDCFPPPGPAGSPAASCDAVPRG